MCHALIFPIFQNNMLYQYTEILLYRSLCILVNKSYDVNISNYSRMFYLVGIFGPNSLFNKQSPHLDVLPSFSLCLRTACCINVLKCLYIAYDAFLSSKTYDVKVSNYSYRCFISLGFLATTHYFTSQDHIYVSCPYFPYVSEQHVILIQ